MRAVLLAMTVSLTFAADAVEISKKQQDRQAILAMAGVFAVDFHFKETVAFEIGYELKEAYDASGLETVIVVEDSENKIALQHILETKRGVLKHWRQDWTYESAELWEYQGDAEWKKIRLPADEVKGTWTQRVYQVDDSPRYESVGRWRHQGNLSQWESALTHRPLPRREHTKRDDYHILAAKNRHTLTPTGWVHEQDNYKLKRTPDGDRVIAREFGLNRYDHVNPDKGETARQWWRDHAAFWADVRGIWADVFAARERIVLRKKVDDKPMYSHMFALSKDTEALDSYDSAAFKEKAAAIVGQFLEQPEKAARASDSEAYSPTPK